MNKQTDEPLVTVEQTEPREEEIQRLSEELRHAHPIDILKWGVKRFGNRRIVLACSFGLEDIVLVDMLTRINPDVDIFYLDTDLLFKETYATRDALAKRYNRSFIRVSGLSLEEQNKTWGPKLWKRDPHQCCSLRKVQPLKTTLQKYHAWITGIRREQAPTRAHAEVIEKDRMFGLVKLNPLAFWTQEEVWAYVRQHSIPYNPLHDRNYPSIGCHPCTRPVSSGEDPRSGRWAGLNKTECGLHPADHT